MDHPDTKTVTRYAISITDLDRSSPTPDTYYIVGMTRYGVTRTRTREDAGTWPTEAAARDIASRLYLGPCEVATVFPVTEPTYND
jgi:hypothetical protein